jgi:hypothetical protein
LALLVKPKKKYDFIERTDYYDDRTGAKLPEPQKWMQLTTDTTDSNQRSVYLISWSSGPIEILEKNKTQRWLNTTTTIR